MLFRSIKFDHTIAKFDHWVDGTILSVKANIIERKIGQYQGSIIISDQSITYHIPILLRISDGAIMINENSGRLDFAIESEQEWSYAKISLYNQDSRLVDSVSITPTKNELITVHDSGTYWIQADLKSGKNTTSIYNTISVESANQNFTLDIGVPYQQLVIIIGIGVIIAMVGLIIRRK